MNQIEKFVYHIVRKNPYIKQIIRDTYQDLFDMLPRKNEFIGGKCMFKNEYFWGFHDICQFSNDESKVLANHLLIQDLIMPTSMDGLGIGYFDFSNDEIGDFHQVSISYAWNYHKGCRLQWVDNESCIFNTIVDKRLVSELINVNTNRRAYLNSAIDTVYSNGSECIATSFSYERLNKFMPGYGYECSDGGCCDSIAPSSTGLFLVDLHANHSELLVSLADLKEMFGGGFKNEYYHYVTHSEFSKDGRYISFLYRATPIGGEGMEYHTKILVYDRNTSNIFELPSQMSGSHYVWNKKNQILASCIFDGDCCYALFDMEDLSSTRVIARNILNSDGHPSFIDDDSFVTDTYPDRMRMSKLLRVDMRTDEVEILCDIYSPKLFQTRNPYLHIACDLHPRVSPSGKYVSFDSARNGSRAFYILKLQ